MKLGIALGGGAARGWAHIGVLRALADAGVKPEIVAGTSVGAIVGAMYALDALDGFERWVRALDRRSIMGLLDLRMTGGGGFFEGDRLRALFVETFGDVGFDALTHPLGIVATELHTGRERWLREGSVASAIRASITLPGLFTPVPQDGEWLVDGGLVNPVPVSLCQAMGADLIIAVNLNGDLIGRHRAAEPPGDETPGADARWFDRLTTELRARAGGLLAPWRQGDGTPEPPALFEVLATSLNIMQDRVTRSRLVGNPPDLIVTPHVGHIALLEFDRAAEAITAGERAVRRMGPGLEEISEILAT